MQSDGYHRIDCSPRDAETEQAFDEASHSPSSHRSKSECDGYNDCVIQPVAVAAVAAQLTLSQQLSVRSNHSSQNSHRHQHSQRSQRSDSSARCDAGGSSRRKDAQELEAAAMRCVPSITVTAPSPDSTPQVLFDSRGLDGSGATGGPLLPNPPTVSSPPPPESSSQDVESPQSMREFLSVGKDLELRGLHEVIERAGTPSGTPSEALLPDPSVHESPSSLPVASGDSLDDTLLGSMDIPQHRVSSSSLSLAATPATMDDLSVEQHSLPSSLGCLPAVAGPPAATTSVEGHVLPTSMASAPSTNAGGHLADHSAPSVEKHELPASLGGIPATGPVAVSPSVASPSVDGQQCPSSGDYVTDASATNVERHFLTASARSSSLEGRPSSSGPSVSATDLSHHSEEPARTGMPQTLHAETIVSGRRNPSPSLETAQEPLLGSQRAVEAEAESPTSVQISVVVEDVSSPSGRANTGELPGESPARSRWRDRIWSDLDTQPPEHGGSSGSTAGAVPSKEPHSDVGNGLQVADVALPNCPARPAADVHQNVTGGTSVLTNSSFQSSSEAKSMSNESPLLTATEHQALLSRNVEPVMEETFSRSRPDDEIAPRSLSHELEGATQQGGQAPSVKVASETTVFGPLIVTLAAMLFFNILLAFGFRPVFKNPHTDELLSWQPYLVMNTVAVSIGLMAFGLPADLVLLSASSMFCAIRIITVEELLEGLSNSGVVAVAVLCVVSKAIDKTKALNGFMGSCLGAPSSMFVAMLRLALPVCSLGTVFNNTPLVAVMIPIVKDWTHRTGHETSHFMMPLSFITMLSACITTMGSSTNLLAVELVPEAHIHFLDLAPVGFFILITGVLYCALISPLLLPANSVHTVQESGRPQEAGGHPTKRPHNKKLAAVGLEAGQNADDAFELETDRYTVYFVLAHDGPLHSRTVGSAGILNCIPPPARISFHDGAGHEDRLMQTDDVLCVENATPSDIASLIAVPGLNLQSLGGQFRSADHQMRRVSTMQNERVQTQRFALPVRKWVAANAQGGWVASQRELFELVVAPGGMQKASRLSWVGAVTLDQLQKPLSDYHCTLIAVRGIPPEQSGVLRLQGGEVLLVEALSATFSEEAKRAFMMVLPVQEEAAPARLCLSPLDPFRPACSVLGLAGCVLLSAFKVVELDAMALMVGLLAIPSGTLTIRELYGAINGPVLLTVAASFGVGSAFSKTGLASTLAKSVLVIAESGGPYTILSSVVCLALLLGVVVSNNTTVILLAPLIKDICRRQNMDLKMVMMAVIYAANLSFATPFSYQTNMMVMPHGKYVFMDYVRFGVPMMLICGAVAIAGTIWYWG